MQTCKENDFRDHHPKRSLFLQNPGREFMECRALDFREEKGPIEGGPRDLRFVDCKNDACVKIHDVKGN